MPGRSGFSDADRGELLHLQAADKPHSGKKGSGLEYGELDLQVADKPHIAHNALHSPSVIITASL